MNFSRRFIIPVLVMAALALGMNRAHALVEDLPPVQCEILYPAGVDGPYQTNTWPNGIVHYQFDANVTQPNRTAMLAAMAEIQNNTSVQFLPRSDQANYIHIRNANVNNSYVGMIGGGQTINIFNWNYKFIMCHELIHALGFWHTQQRSDRNNYVTINTSAICCNAVGNFDIANVSVFGPYDFDSVMHYDRCAFTNCGACTTANCFTIIVPPPNQAWQNLIGQRTHLSQGDINGINFLYPGAPGAIVWVDFFHGGAQTGAFATPYKTLQAGLDAVNLNGTIYIKPGETIEPFPDGINKKCTIEAPNGVVIIKSEP